MKVAAEIHEALGVHSHVIHNLSNSGFLARVIGEAEGLPVHGSDNGRANAHARDKAAVEILVQEDGLDDGRETHAKTNQVTTVEGFLGVTISTETVHEEHHLLQQQRLSKGEQVLSELEQLWARIEKKKERMSM